MAAWSAGMCSSTSAAMTRSKDPSGNGIAVASPTPPRRPTAGRHLPRLLHRGEHGGHLPQARPGRCPAPPPARRAAAPRTHAGRRRSPGRAPGRRGRPGAGRSPRSARRRPRGPPPRGIRWPAAGRAAARPAAMAPAVLGHGGAGHGRPGEPLLHPAQRQRRTAAPAPRPSRAACAARPRAPRRRRASPGARHPRSPRAARRSGWRSAGVPEAMCSTAGSENPSYSDGTTAISALAISSARSSSLIPLTNLHPVAEGQLADEPLRRAAGGGPADHGQHGVSFGGELGRPPAAASRSPSPASPRWPRRRSGRARGARAWGGTGGCRRRAGSRARSPAAPGSRGRCRRGRTPTRSAPARPAARPGPASGRTSTSGAWTAGTGRGPRRARSAVHADRVVDAGDQRAGRGGRCRAGRRRAPGCRARRRSRRGAARSARRARRLNVSGSGKAPVHIVATSSASIQSRYSPGRGVRNGSSFAVQVQARQPVEQRARLELGVGLAGEHLDVMSERGQLAGQMPQVDALAAAVRLAPVGQQRHPERAIGGGSRESGARPRCWHRAHAGLRLLLCRWQPAPKACPRGPLRKERYQAVPCVLLRPIRMPGHASRDAVSVCCRDVGPWPAAATAGPPDAEILLTRRALITGITGQDGSYLAEHLLGPGV